MKIAFAIGLFLAFTISFMVNRARHYEEQAPLYPGGLVLPHVQDTINDCLSKGLSWEARISGSADGLTLLTNPRCVEKEK